MLLAVWFALLVMVWVGCPWCVLIRVGGFVLGFVI